MQNSSQFSPEHLLINARRAEAEGRTAYAIQFYRHIAESFPHTREAQESRAALARLAEPQPQLPPLPLQQQPAPHPQEVHRLAADARPESTPQPARREQRPRPAAAPAAPAGYRIGRIVAAMFASMGWLLLGAGVIASLVVAAALTVGAVPRGLRELVAGNLPLFTGTTFAALFLGLIAICAGQAARAIFDAADASRELLAQERARKLRG